MAFAELYPWEPTPSEVKLVQELAERVTNETFFGDGHVGKVYPGPSSSSQVMRIVNAGLAQNISGWSPAGVKLEGPNLNRNLRTVISQFRVSEKYEELPVLRTITAAFYRANPMVDLSNRRTWRSLGLPYLSGLTQPRQQERGFRRLLTRDVQNSAFPVEMVDRRSAINGFLQLYIESIRTIGKVGPPDHENQQFTVHTHNHGYQLEYFPQYLYSPVVFGNVLSTPVSSRLATGHYCFQGWRNGTLIRDSGVYYAEPGRSTHLRDF